MNRVTLHCGDVLSVLRELPAESVHCCVTSPPYWGLRDYGVPGQLGLEKTPEEYIEKMVAVFREVKRILRKDGTLWLNMGDSYASGGRTTYDGDKKSEGRGGNFRPGSGRADGVVDERCQRNRNGTPPVPGLKPKDLCMIPARLALALQAPYIVPCCVKSEVDRAWLAGIFDGEGTISIRRFQSYRIEKRQEYQDGFVAFTSVANSDMELLDKCISITGFGSAKIKWRGHAGDIDNRGIVTKRDNYGWRLDGNSAIEVIRAIYPYLTIKKKQAILAYNLDISNKNGRSLRGNGKLPQTEQERREYLKTLINACNQREPVDIPSWCVEPQPIIEPGWYLRSDIIWAKKNCMPESCTDRPTTAHEHIFLLTKSAKYFYDAEAVREECKQNSGQNMRAPQCGEHRPANPLGKITQKTYAVQKGANLRSVWTLSTKPFPEAHFATFPTSIPERCIKAGSKDGDLILDPFSGAATTLMVAAKLGRDAVGIELNPSYVEMSVKRLKRELGMLCEIMTK